MKGKYSSALGFGASAIGEGSVALGADSQQKIQMSFQQEEIKQTKNGAIYRRVNNVANGVNDNDAVNMAQLNARTAVPLTVFNGGEYSNKIYKPAVGDNTWSATRIVFGDGLKRKK